jgi:hypothetical protein
MFYSSFTNLASYSLAPPYPNPICCLLSATILTFKQMHTTLPPEPSQTLSLLLFSPPNCRTFTFLPSASLPTNPKPYLRQSSFRRTRHLLIEPPQQQFHTSYSRHLFIDTLRQRPATFSPSGRSRLRHTHGNRRRRSKWYHHNDHGHRFLLLRRRLQVRDSAVDSGRCPPQVEERSATRPLSQTLASLPNLLNPP